VLLCAVDPVSYSMIFSSSCDVPCDVLLGSVCQKVIDTVPGESRDVTIALMHVDELVYAVVSHSSTGRSIGSLNTSIRLSRLRQGCVTHYVFLNVILNAFTN